MAIMERFELPNINFIKIELECNSSEISITEWFTYINQYF